MPDIGSAQWVLAERQLSHPEPAQDQGSKGRQPGKVGVKQACWATLFRSLPQAVKWKWRELEQVAVRALML